MVIFYEKKDTCFIVNISWRVVAFGLIAFKIWLLAKTFEFRIMSKLIIGAIGVVITVLMYLWYALRD